MTRPVAIHQFHSGASDGDAITEEMFALQRVLRKEGYISDVFAEHIAEGLADRIRPISTFACQPASLLLVHHSIGHSAFEDVFSLDIPIVTVFHSITPLEFFSDPFLTGAIRAGFIQLRRLAQRSLFGIADSNFNRKQMLDVGFERVDVLPVKTDYTAFHKARISRSGASDDWLFVGRIVPNKRQDRLIAAFSCYRRTYGVGHLHLVGDTSFEPYLDVVREAVVKNGVEDWVILHGKVSQSELEERYRTAGVFVCMSEHEGFGVPLLEAMAAGVPVVARRAAAVTETLAGAGVLIEDEDPETTAAVARLLIADTELREQMVSFQDERLRRIEEFDVAGLIRRLADDATEAVPRPLHVQVQGPFETSYSLAILNRNLALELDRQGYCVTLHATEGPGDYDPSQKNLAQHPRAAGLYRSGLERPFPDVAIRQMYPPRVDDSDAAMTFQYFGWEESGLPPAVVADFNKHLDGIGAMSTYVRDILIDAGVEVPIEVVGVGVHEPDADAIVIADELADLRRVRFLHISSAFPRKGVDVIVRAYFEAFDAGDDVSLVLKTFPNPHNTVAELLDELREEHSAPPHVCWIDRDLSRRELDGLYGLADGYVHPARGEGFGLPVAEAMLAAVPVISVAATGLSDIVSPATAAVVGHEFRTAHTHLSVPGSLWAEPSQSDLVREFRALFTRTDEVLRRERVETAQEHVRSRFTWERVAERWMNLICESVERRAKQDVIVVTPFNSRCGIAEYSAALYGRMDAWSDFEIHADIGAVPVDDVLERRVYRTWRNFRSGPVDELLDVLDASSASLTHVQYNMGFFSIGELGRLLRHETDRRPTVVTLHRTAPHALEDRTESFADIAEELRSCAAVVVHQQLDRKRLVSIGVDNNVHVIPIGVPPPVNLVRREARHRHGVPTNDFVLGAYGFLLPHKGLLKILQALAELRSRGIDAYLVASCALHPDVRSAGHLTAVKEEIERLGLGDDVLLVTDYLDHDESLDLLATADVVVLPYEHTDESSSAALRSLLPLGPTIVTSDISIFEDVKRCVHQVPHPVEPSVLADKLELLWMDPDERSRLGTALRDFSQMNDWGLISRRTQDLYDAVLASSQNRRPTAAAT